MNYEREFEMFASVIRSLESVTGDDMASEIYQAIASCKMVADGLKTVGEYADEIKDIGKRGEFMRIIGKLNLELAETELKLSERIREIDDLQGQVNKLQKEIESLKNPDTKLTIRNGLYYGSDNSGPFCTGCYDSKGQRITVIKLSDLFSELGTHKCPTCKTYQGRK